MLPELARRFPYVLDDILARLEWEDLENVRLACPRLQEFLEDQPRFRWRATWRRISLAHGNFTESKAAWDSLVLRRSFARLKAFTMACERFFLANPVRRIRCRRQVCCVSVSVKYEPDSFAVLKNVLFT